MRRAASRVLSHPLGISGFLGGTLFVGFVSLGLSLSSVMTFTVMGLLGGITLIRPEIGLYLLILNAVASFGQFIEMPRIGPLSLPLAVEGVLILAIFFQMAVYGRKLYLNVTENWLLLCHFSAVVLSMVLADHFGPENIQAFRTRYLVQLVAYGLIVSLVNTLGKLHAVLATLIIVNAILVSSGVLNYMGLMEINQVNPERIAGRTAGIIGDPNNLAFTLIGLLPFVLMFIIVSNSPALRTGLTMLLAGDLFVVLNTLSRGGFISLCAVLLFLTFKFSRDRRLVVLLVLVCIVVYLLLPGALFDRFDEVRSLQGNSRYRLAMIGLNMSVHNPVLGVGLGNFRRYFSRYDEVHRGGVTAPHNLYTAVAAESGIPVLLIYLVLIAMSWQRLAGVQAATRDQKRRSLFWLLSVTLQASHVNILVFGLTSHHAYHYLVFITLALTIVMERVHRLDMESPVQDKVTVRTLDTGHVVPVS
ncbi:MAG: O-antigen ligase family protein [Acidobacteriota bacterium]